MHDANLVTRILGGDTTQYAALVERYLPLVRGICASHVSDPSAQDDLVQEAFLAGYLRLDRLRNRARFGPWLARIARHKCLGWLRARARHRTAHEAMARMTEHPSAPDPVQEATRSEMRAWARREISGLPDGTREAMVLCYVEGYPAREAARLLGIRETSIRKRLEYGRRLVGERMLREFGERPGEERTQHLERRVLSALPLASAPWAKATAASSTGAAAAIGTGAVLAKIAAIAATLAAVGGAVGWYATRPEAPEVAASSPSGDAPDAAGQPDDRKRASREAEAVSPESPGGTLVLRLRYRMRPPQRLPAGPATPEPGEPDGRDVTDDPPPVAGAHVTLKPLRPNRQVRDMLFRDTDLDPRLEPWLTARASGDGMPSWETWAERERLDPDLLAREKPKLLALRETYGETGLRGLFEQLVGPAPREAWLHGESSGGGTVVFDELAPGTYRAEVSLPDPEVDRAARENPAPSAGPEDATENVRPGPRTAAATTVRIGNGERVTRTLDVADTVSEIRGGVVDADSGEPVGPLSLVASGEVLGDAEHRMWVGADGRFAIPVMATGFGAFSIEAEPHGFVPVTVRGERRPGEPVRVTIPLRRRPTISGYVLEPDGTPVPDISVMRGDVDRSGARGVARTGEEGHYSAPHDGGVITLWASGTMCRSEERTFELAADESLLHDFTMPPTATVFLDIRTETDAVPDDIDAATLRTGGHSLAGTILERQGDHYEVRHLEPGRYHLVFGVRGYETVSLDFTIGEDLADRRIPVLLEPAVHSLAVQVVGVGGIPLSGIDLNLMLVVEKLDENGRRTGFSASSIDHATSDADGRAAFDRLAPGTYRIVAGGASEEVTVPRNEPVLLAITSPETDPGGLTLALDEARAFDALEDGLPLDLEDDTIRVLSPSGTVSRNRLEAGENLVFAFKSGYPPAITAIDIPAEVIARERASGSDVWDEPFELAFGDSGSVVGVVESGDAKRLADQELTVFPLEAWDAARRGSDRHEWRSFGRLFASGARSDDEGRFEIRFLPPGTYVASTARGGASVPFEVFANRETGPVIVVR